MLQKLKRTPKVELFQAIGAEAFGTFILVFSVGVTQGNPTSVAPALWAAMIATGFVSGGQFNPAVSVAVVIHALLSASKDLMKKIVLSAIFIVVQVAFGFFGAYFAYLVINTNERTMAFFDVSSGYTDGEAFVCELFFTTVLTGCAIIGGHYTNSNILVGGLVATTVSAGDYSVGRYSGGCFNPAVGFGINMMHYAIKGGTSHNVWLYITAPTLGGVLGGSFATFFIYNKKDLKELRNVYY